MKVDTASISLRLSATNPGCELKITLDDQILRQGPVGTEAEDLVFDFEDTDGDRKLIFEMSGKTKYHTKINSDGEIAQDLLIQIRNIELDGINIDQICWQSAEYHHDFNGSQEPTVDKFYGDMGCNGRVIMEFSSPVYLWLLENM